MSYRCDCSASVRYYLKTRTCKFGVTCKFHHPRNKTEITGRVSLNMFGYPLRPVMNLWLLQWQAFQCIHLKSPMAGTFYRSPGPGEPPFVKVGDKVQKGQVVCIIEAMKLMNEIEAEKSGTINELLAEDGKPVSVDTIQLMEVLLLTIKCAFKQLSLSLEFSTTFSFQTWRRMTFAVLSNDERSPINRKADIFPFSASLRIALIPSSEPETSPLLLSRYNPPRPMSTRKYYPNPCPSKTPNPNRNRVTLTLSKLRGSEDPRLASGSRGSLCYLSG